MKDNKKKQVNMSYESDGKMGKQKKNEKLTKKKQTEFFNVTQNSE